MGIRSAIKAAMKAARKAMKGAAGLLGGAEAPEDEENEPEEAKKKPRKKAPAAKAAAAPAQAAPAAPKKKLLSRFQKSPETRRDRQDNLVSRIKLARMSLVGKSAGHNKNYAANGMKVKRSAASLGDGLVNRVNKVLSGPNNMMVRVATKNKMKNMNDLKATGGGRPTSPKPRGMKM